MRRWALGRGLVLLAGVLLLFWVAPPWPIALWEAETLAYALCHRIPSHSIFVAGQQLPLCARCSGIYLSGLGTLGVLAWRRPRAKGWPESGLLAMLLLYVGLMAFDGVNSFLSMLPGLPSLYQPHNALRLVTGALHGAALAIMVWPVWNQTVWRDARDDVVLSWGLLGVATALALGVAFVLWLALPILLWPLVLLSGLSILLFVGAINAIVVLVASGKDQRLHRWDEVAPIAVYALLLTLIELGGLNLLRRAAGF